MNDLETATNDELFAELHKRCRLFFACYEPLVTPNHIKMSGWIQPGGNRGELIGLVHYCITGWTNEVWRQHNNPSKE